MRLASIDNGLPDGQLVIVSNDNERFIPYENSLVPNFLSALDNWSEIRPKLDSLYQSLNSNKSPGNAIASAKFRSPLPRSFAFFDGSAFLSHVIRARKARGAEIPPDLHTRPLMYQGSSAPFLNPDSDIRIIDVNDELDFEAELAVVTTYVPQGVNVQDASSHIVALMLLNDLSLRALIKTDLASGFGFLHGKPLSSFAPIAVTPDDIGASWNNGKPILNVKISRNKEIFGELSTSELHFSFQELISYAAQRQSLPAGTIIGSGTVSSSNSRSGFACIVEKRYEEVISDSSELTPYLSSGELVTLEGAYNSQSIFGKIEHSIIG